MEDLKTRIAKQFIKKEEINKKTQPCYLLTVAKQGVEIFCVEPIENECNSLNACHIKTTDHDSACHYFRQVASYEYTGSDIAETSLAANWLAVDSKEGLKIIDLQNHFMEYHTFPIKTCKRAMFSPKGNYLLVLVRHAPGVKKPNLNICSLQHKIVIHSLDVSVALERWPPIFFSEKETYFFHLKPKNISVYKEPFSFMSEPFATLSFENVQTVSVSPDSPNKSVHIGTFIAPQKQKPGTVFISCVETNLQVTILLSEELHHVQDVSFHWNHLGTVLLVVGQSNVDKSGRSYYGTSNLTFLQAKPNGRILRIIEDDAGPVSACQWCPTSNDFVVISGPILSTKLILYDGLTGLPKLSFGNGRRNTIRFDPFGRFLCFAGFGNLPGEIDIWNLNKKKLIGETKVPVTVEFEWAPDGRMMLAATTTPRMRVDNCVKILRYTGELLDKMDFDNLYATKWIPAKRGTHISRAASLQRTIQQDKCLNQFACNAPYRVTRSTENGISSARFLSKPQAPKIATVITCTSKLPPGAQFVDAPQSKSARRNALRRKKNKEARDSKLQTKEKQE